MNPIARFFWSVIFILAGGTAIAFFGKVARLQCHRLEPIRVDCQLTSSGLLGKNTTAIAQLQGAEIEMNRNNNRRRTNRGNTRDRSNNRDNLTYRVMLIAANDRTPLTEYYSSGRSGHEKKVKTIRNFLNNSTEKNLVIKEDSRWLIYPIGGLFVLLGLAILFGAPVKQR